MHITITNKHKMEIAYTHAYIRAYVYVHIYL